MSISVMPVISERERDEHKLLDDHCPDYDTATSRSPNPNDPPSTRALKVVSLMSTASHQPNLRPLPRLERYIYSYRLLANVTPLQFFISVEPESGKPRSGGKYTFRLSFKVNGIERSLGEPTTRTLKVDPRQLDFVVFMFPGKSSLPAGCLWSLRVWLRVNAVDHRLFGEDELWVAKDPDFTAITDASFARLRSLEAGEQIYHGYVGKALVAFIVKWGFVTNSNNLYKFSLSYEANGVGDTLFEDFRLRLDGDPRAVTFLIFTIPNNSMPAGASHKLRVWIRSLIPAASGMSFYDSYIYQRIWKCDSFKIGGRLDFISLGPKLIMGVSMAAPETTCIPNPPPVDLHSPTRSVQKDRREYDL